MSRNGMGGKEYDDFLRGMEEHPREMPAALICSQDTIKQLEQQFGSPSQLHRISHGYAGTCVGVEVWIDNRFDEPLFISGL